VRTKGFPRQPVSYWMTRAPLTERLEQTRAKGIHTKQTTIDREVHTNTHRPKHRQTGHYPN